MVHRPNGNNRPSTSSLRPAITFLVLFNLVFGMLAIPRSWRSFLPSASAAGSATVVVSQVYGGAGCGTANCSTYKNDYVEIFNRGSSSVNLSGWSVQYASSTGSFNAATPLSGALAPGQYYLIQEGSGSNGTNNLPTPDASGTIAMSATAGKVIVANTATALGCGATGTSPAPCSSAQLAQIVDLVGYGTGTTLFEGSGPTPAPSTSNAVFRAGGGCTDTDNNAADFSAGASNPRNTSSPMGTCNTSTPTPTPTPSVTPTPNPTNPTGTGAASPNSVLPGGSTTFTVNVTSGTNPSSTGLAVSADLSSIGGSASQVFSGIGNTFTFSTAVDIETAPGNKTIPFTISDGQGRSGSGSIALTVKTPQPPNTVVISQVYGGGGNTGADFKNDFIELVNHSSAPVNLFGWSVQYASVTQSNWQATALPDFTLQPGQYFLIQESAGAGGTTDLPSPDATGLIPMGAANGKVALVNNTTLLTSGCPDFGAAGVVDFVGYGTAECFEATAAPALDNTTAAERRFDGCADTNDNSADFTAALPDPRNSSSPTHACTDLFGYGTATPSSVVVGNSVTLKVVIAPAQSPPSTNITVSADLSAIGGSQTQILSGGGSVYSFNTTIPVNTSGGFKSLPVTISDDQGRTLSTNIVFSVLPLVADHITISQIYGGGGNTSAPYQNDYVELFNPTASPVTVTGWSIQYASATGTSWTNKQPIGGTIGSGEYMLVALASGGATGSPLPPSQISGGINMSGTAGKVALVKNSDNLTDTCPLGTNPNVVDFVGYGTTANCHEGTANAPAPSNTTAIFRKSNGSQDTDQNGNDFATGAPNPRQTAPIAELGPWVAGTDPATNGNTIPHDATVTVDFSEAVDVAPGWFNIVCSISGLHNDATVAHTNDFKSYAITPNVNFQFGEQCSVTIPKTTVHDQDTNDSLPDTDTLLADYTWSFTVVAAGQPAPYAPSVHLTMGDPSCGSVVGCATTDIGNPNNYLMEKPTYSLSYNRDKGTPNWVSWHLDSSWYGTLARVDTFRADPAVPADWYRVEGFDYSGSGFDRGHMTPNADRDNQNRIPINQETYLMSNMVPQSPDNNQGPWAQFEAYLRTLADAGNELYIVSGPYGMGGSGSNGGTTNTIANGHVTVPAATWKVVVVLPKGDDDVNRVTAMTRTIAIQIPNVQGIRTVDWHTYLTTVKTIEAETGYDFFSNVPQVIQNSIEAGTDGTNPPGTANQSVSAIEDTPVQFTLNALDPSNSPLTAMVATPGHGSISCLNITCTYLPTSNFNGVDAFTFSVSNGTNSSNTSTVTINVASVNDLPTASNDQPANYPSVQYSDAIQPIGFSASDIETPADQLVPTETFSKDGAPTQSGLPAGLSLTQTANTGQWTLAGNVAASAGTYSIAVTFTDTDGGTASTSTSITITKEDATLTLSGPTAVSVDPSTGRSMPFTLSADIAQAADGALGNINNAVPVTFQLTPVGSGLPAYSCTAAAITPGTTTASCTFNDVNVDVYDISAVIGGDYYQGSNRSVIAVYDPALGFVTGSGSLVRTVNGETFTADFSVNLKYQKNGTAVGSVTYVEHHATGNVSFVSSSMGALAITSGGAKITGSGTLDGISGYSFIGTFVDAGEPGTNDKTGFRLTDSGGNVIANLSFDPLRLSAGNIRVH